MKDSILDRAVYMATGKRLAAKKDGVIKLRVKQMALAVPDAYNVPPVGERGYPTGKPYTYGDLSIQEFSQGALLTVGRRQEWYANPHRGFRNYRLIKNLMIGKGLTTAPGREEFDRVAPEEFGQLAIAIKPDTRKPSQKAMGPIKAGARNPTVYAGGKIKVTNYEGGALLEYGNKSEWFKGPRRGLAYDKARYLADIYQAM